jgi:hypothetical protein
MTEDEQRTKNKEGISNVMLIMGIIFIVGGAIYGFSNTQENALAACKITGFGTILTFTSVYMRHGYFKFFN